MSRLAATPVRWSWLSKLALSPAHALHAATAGWEPSAAMKLGTAAHAATFEPHRLVVYRGGDFPDGKGKVKTYSDTRNGRCWEAFKSAQPPEAVIVSEAEFATAHAVADALRRADAERTDPETGAPLPLLFGPGVVHERNIRWTRKGRACSSTPDARNPGRWVVDLKCLRSAEPADFKRQATYRGYRSQLTFYQEADAEDLGLAMPVADLYSIVVEPRPPFVVTTFKLDEFSIGNGRRQIDAWWSILENCEATDHWPGYAQSVVTLTDDDPEEAFGVFGGFEPDDDAANGNASGDGDDTQPIDWSAA